MNECFTLAFRTPRLRLSNCENVGAEMTESDATLSFFLLMLTKALVQEVLRFGHRHLSAKAREECHAVSDRNCFHPRRNFVIGFDRRLGV